MFLSSNFSTVFLFLNNLIHLILAAPFLTTSNPSLNPRDYPIFTSGDPDNQPGIYLRNADPTRSLFFFLYENSHDNSPWKYTFLGPGVEIFVSVHSTFQGRVVRGDPHYFDGQPHLWGTWVEISMAGPVMWADVSLIKGCDGAATVEAADGSQIMKGFTQDIYPGAPAAYVQKPSGSWILAPTEGECASPDIEQWELLVVGQENAYINEIPPHPVICSQNGRFAVVFYPGIA